MFTFLSILYVFVCLFLILVVLLQSGKGGGMGALGGGANTAGQQVFGGAGASNILSRMTAVFAALFMILSATLAYLSSPGDQALENAAAVVGASDDAPDNEADTAGEADAPAEPAGEADAPAEPAGEADAPAEPAGEADAPAAEPAGEADAPAEPAGEADAPAEPAGEADAPAAEPAGEAP